MRAAPAWFVVGSLAVVACAKPGGPKGPTPDAAAVEVAIASVTLADDCPDNRGPAWSLPAPSAPAEAAAAEPAAPPAADMASSQSAAKRAPGGGAYSAQEGEAACEQSFVQLRVRGPASGGATRFAIKKIELLDDAGAVLGELTARAPTAWQGDHYEPWAETIAAGDDLATAYELTAPAWATYGKGPFESHDGVYTLRVTVAVGDDERTLTQQTVVSGPAVLPPGAVT
ncbi:MAG: hypothetical protein JNK64_20445 [Myxococcales bacterium]|nr:hypothetical protein [Myxococcales bacterium]